MGRGSTAFDAPQCPPWHIHQLHECTDKRSLEYSAVRLAQHAFECPGRSPATDDELSERGTARHPHGHLRPYFEACFAAGFRFRSRPLKLGAEREAGCDEGIR